MLQVIQSLVLELDALIHIPVRVEERVWAQELIPTFRQIVLER
jgi:hypothetical protein